MKIFPKKIRTLVKSMASYSILFIGGLTIPTILFLIIVNTLSPDFARKEHLELSLDLILAPIKYGLIGGILIGFFIGLFNWLMDLRNQKLHKDDKGKKN